MKEVPTSPLICSVSVWTGFYMIEISVMKKLILQIPEQTLVQCRSDNQCLTCFTYFWSLSTDHLKFTSKYLVNLNEWISLRTNVLVYGFALEIHVNIKTQILSFSSAGNFLFKVKNENTRTMWNLFTVNIKDTRTTLLTSI